MKNVTPKELPLYKQKYTSAYKQFDKYIVFVERAMNLLKDNGLLGYIVPLKFMKVGAGQELRGAAYRVRLFSFWTFQRDRGDECSGQPFEAHAE